MVFCPFTAVGRLLSMTVAFPGACMIVALPGPPMIMTLPGASKIMRLLRASKIVTLPGPLMFFFHFLGPLCDCDTLGLYMIVTLPGAFL